MITAAKRRSIPKSEFGEPGERKYPVDTKARARAAKSYAAKEANEGKLSHSAKKRIDAKADRKLGKAAKHLDHESHSHPLAR